MDGVSKKVVATFADREKQESAVVNLKDFSAYGNLEQIVKWVISNLHLNNGKLYEL